MRVLAKPRLGLLRAFTVRLLVHFLNELFYGYLRHLALLIHY